MFLSTIIEMEFNFFLSALLKIALLKLIEGDGQSQYDNVRQQIQVSLSHLVLLTLACKCVCMCVSVCQKRVD